MKRQNEAHPKRAEALQLLADGVAPVDVARQLDVKPSTVRMWKSRAQRKPARVEASELVAGEVVSSEVTLTAAQQTISDAQTAARLAIKRLHDILPKARGPQAVALAAGIMLDKAAQLEDRLAEQEDRQRMLLERDSELMGAVLNGVLRCVLKAHGTDPSMPSVRRLVRDLLTQAGNGAKSDELVAPQPLAAEVRKTFQDSLRREVRLEMAREEARRVEEERASRLALPAPASSDDALRSWQERAREEIVDAEVVS